MDKKEVCKPNILFSIPSPSHHLNEIKAQYRIVKATRRLQMRLKFAHVKLLNGWSHLPVSIIENRNLSILSKDSANANLKLKSKPCTLTRPLNLSNARSLISLSRKMSLGPTEKVSTFSIEESVQKQRSFSLMSFSSSIVSNWENQQTSQYRRKSFFESDHDSTVQAAATMMQLSFSHSP